MFIGWINFYENSVEGETVYITGDTEHELHINILKKVLEKSPDLVKEWRLSFTPNSIRFATDEKAKNVYLEGDLVKDVDDLLTDMAGEDFAGFYWHKINYEIADDVPTVYTLCLTWNESWNEMGYSIMFYNSIADDPRVLRQEAFQWLLKNFTDDLLCELDISSIGKQDTLRKAIIKLNSLTDGTKRGEDCCGTSITFKIKEFESGKIVEKYAYSPRRWRKK